jgi:formate hydrogenlyase transcriptional activator
VDLSTVQTGGLLQLAIEASPNGILLIDSRGTIALVNRSAEHQFGYARQELLGRRVEDLLPEAVDAVRAAQTEAVTIALNSDAPETPAIASGRRKDGSRFALDVRLKPIRTTELTCVLATLIDRDVHHAEPPSRAATPEEHAAFELIAVELLNDLLNVPDDDLALAIERGLHRACDWLGLDGAAVSQLSSDGARTEIAGWGGAPHSRRAWPPERSLYPRLTGRTLAGNLVPVGSLTDIVDDVDRHSFQSAGLCAALIAPLHVGGLVVGSICLVSSSNERNWQDDDIKRIGVLSGVFDQVLERRQREETLRSALAEVRSLKEELQTENPVLRKVRKAETSSLPVGESPAARRVMELIEQVAATDSTVLLLGETGTGKEVFASRIHELGSRRNRPMVRVNCAAIPSTLIESELFGREKGAFTGALARQVGRFELADKATIFLDEIGDLPLDVQVKLLRVLEEGQIERLGSPTSIKVDTRIIAATHQDLQQRISDGVFREDLFYRLNVFPIRVPPLRERVEDIPNLVWQFVGEFSKAFGKRIESISNESIKALQQYPWPGNIRELRNIVERATIVCTGPRLTIAVPPSSNTAARRSLKLVDVERQHLRAVLESTHWRVRGEGGAAARLGLKPTTLETRMARLGLRRPDRR